MVAKRGVRSGLINDQSCDLANGDFVRVAEIAGAVYLLAALHEQLESVQQIIDITERARLGAVAVDRDWLIPQCLHDKVGDHPPIVFQHARAIGIEDTGDLGVEAK